MKSKAPFSRHSIVSSEDFFEKLLKTITGILIPILLIFFNADIPSITGISTSKVTTSGENSSSLENRSSPFLAVVTTSILDCEFIMSEIIFLIKAESSTTKTFAFFNVNQLH